jgi:predicted  nucleic acid-binding Zn-ribbon protein
MTDDTSTDGLRNRVSRQSEEALGRIAQDLLENPLVAGALSRAFDARERAAQAQEAAMGALNLPSAADLERLTRRVRSVSQRLEGIEDAVDRLDQRLAGADQARAVEERLDALEAALREAIAALEASAGKPAARGAAKPKASAATRKRPAAS